MYLNKQSIINNMYDTHNNIVWSFPNDTLLNKVRDTWNLITYYYDNYYTFAVYDKHSDNELLSDFRLITNGDFHKTKFKKYFSKMYNKHNNILSFIQTPFDNNYNYSLCTATHTLGLNFCKYDSWSNELIYLYNDKENYAQLKYWNNNDCHHYGINDHINKMVLIDLELRRKIYLYVRNDIVF